MTRTALLLVPMLLTVFLSLRAQEAEPNADTSAENISRHEYQDAASGARTAYLLYTPANETPPAKRALLIFLYGAGGSLENYNLKRPPYALLREQLSARGYYVVVPDLGTHHFMNDAAKAALDGVVAEVLNQQQIPATRVHLMGTSMGAGSSLAYTIHRPDRIRSVCAVMPMTDFATWVEENPHYVTSVASAYGGTYEQHPEAYDQNSALRNVDAFAHIPVMLIHGDADPTVSYAQSQRLAQRLEEKNYSVAFYTVEGQAHKDDVMQDYQRQAIEFFDAAMGDPDSHGR